MQRLPFQVRVELEGWDLFWALLERQSCDEQRRSIAAGSVAGALRRELQVETLSAQSTVAALRALFKAAGCDPTRYRPSSEALLRRILKGEDMPVIHPLVDLNNWLSASLAAPCCVMREEALVPPYVFRAGRRGENYESLRGPFNLEGKPLLVDERGPVDAPITGSERVKVLPETQRVWLVSYLPSDAVSPFVAEQKLLDLLDLAPVARVHITGRSPNLE